MKTVGLALTLLLSQPLLADILIPEITPAAPGYADIQKTVAHSASHSDHYLDFNYRGITGSVSYQVDGVKSKNTLDTIFVLNGKYFSVPTNFESSDNSHQFVFSNGTGGLKPGIYIIDSGFRVDLELDRPARVVATTRIADEAGVILPALEYSEVLTQAQTPDLLETHPRVNLADYSWYSPRESIMDSPHPSDFNVDETQPGAITYAKIFQILDWAEGYDEVYFTKFQFAGVAGRLSAPGPGAIKGNDLPMYIQLGGKVYKIPFDYYFYDNWQTFTRETGAHPGIYLTQRGFRKDSTTGLLTRVISKIRIADLGGAPLTSLEYHEDVRLVAEPSSDIQIEREF